MPDLAGAQVPTDLMTIVDLSQPAASQNVKSTLNDAFAEITKNITDLTVQFGNGVTGTVSAAGKGKIRYNDTAKSFQVSEDGGAYQNLLKGSGTATRVAFWSAADELSSDAALYWQNTDKRLGIGVGTTPLAPLDILADATAVAQQWRPNTGTMRAQMILDTGPETFFGTVTPHNLHFITNNIQRISIEDTSGNVGINKITAIAAQLQVVANSATTKGLIVQSAALTSVNIAELYNDAAIRYTFGNDGTLTLGLAGASGATGQLTFSVNGQANTQTLRAGDTPAASNTYKWPSADPTAGQVLTASAPSAGVVTLSWSTGGGGTTINPTDGVMPVRSNATTFIDSPLSVASSAVTMTRAAIGTAQSDGIILLNSTAAAAGAQQYSPMLRLTGFGWKTNAVAASQQTDWVLQAQPVQGAAAPTVNLVFLSQINTGGFVQQFSVTSSAIAQIGTTGGTLYFGNSNHSITASDASNTMAFVPSSGITALTLTASRVRVIGGNGVDAAGIETTANSGNIDLTIAPQARGGNAGTGGAIYLHGGTGSTSGSPTVGGAVHVYGGAGGTNQNGGNLYLYGGALNGSGVDGDIYLGYNNSVSRGIIFIQGTDLAFVRNSASVLRVTNGSTGIGSVLIGTSTDSLTGNFTVMSSNAATNTVVTVARLGVNSTGTAADGFGSALSWSAETSTTNDTQTGLLSYYWTTATHASRTSAVSFTLVNNATTTEVARIGTPSNNVGSPFVLSIYDGTNPNVWTAGSFAAKLYLISPTLPAVGVAAHFSATGADAPVWQMLRGRGTNASPTAAQSGDGLGAVEWAGQTSTSTNNFAVGARIRVSATENWSAGNNGCQMIFFTSNNAGTITDRMYLKETGTVRIGATAGSYNTTTLLQVGNYSSWNTDVVAAIYTGANGTKALQIIGTNGATANLIEVYRDSLTVNLLTLAASGVLSLRAGLNTGTTVARVGGTIHQDTTPVSNSGTGETNLMTYSLPANTMGTDADYVLLDLSGEFVSPTGNSRLRVYFGSTVIFDTTALAFTTGTWRFQAKVTRTSSTDQVAVTTFSGDTTLVPVTGRTAAPAETMSGAITIKVTGQGAASDEIFQTDSKIQWWPAAA